MRSGSGALSTRGTNLHQTNTVHIMRLISFLETYSLEIPQTYPKHPKPPQTPQNHHRTYNALNFYFWKPTASKYPKPPQTPANHYRSYKCAKTFLGHSPQPLRGGWGHMLPALPPPPPPPPPGSGTGIVQ